MIKKILLSLLTTTAIQALPPINIFRPYDRPLIPEYGPCTGWQFTVGYEGALRIRGYQEDDDDEKSWEQRRVDPLQVWQCKQDLLAAFRGLTQNPEAVQCAQLIAVDNAPSHGRFQPTAKFEIPVNLMFTARYYLPLGFNVALHLPYYEMKLTEVNFLDAARAAVGPSSLVQECIDQLPALSGINFGPWQRKGVGDLFAQVTWMCDFPQAKPLLTNVRPIVRVGFSMPTGVKQNEDLLLAFPFGNDGSWGVEVAGGLDLTFNCHLKAGLDIDLLQLFGNKRPRRIKTDLAQTDLLFLNKIEAFKEFGSTQQYNVFLQACMGYGLNFRVDFQHLKHNEDKLYVCNDRLDTLIVNSAESIQDWTTNSLIFNVIYNPECSFRPYISAWYKWGFLGKRALLADTLGISISLSF